MIKPADSTEHPGLNKLYPTKTQARYHQEILDYRF